MTNRSPSSARRSTAHTLYFPISGDPAGFNHFAAAEWVLRGVPELERVEFIISNGRHPDPTKADARTGAEERLRMCRLAAGAVADPALSLLARRAEGAGERLLAAGEAVSFSTLEFQFQRAVRSAEAAARLLEGGENEGARLHWFAGSDLIARMADPRIFTDEDLEFLSRHCQYQVLEREGHPLESALALLQAERGVTLSHRAHRPAEVPHWLAPFLELSSTLIRNAAEAGDPLAGMLPAPAVAALEAGGYYRPGRPEARVVDLAGTLLEERTVLEMEIGALERALRHEAAELAGRLEARRAAGRPHSLAVVETTTGGLITAALAGRSGASRYFRQSRFAYDEQAKTQLLEGRLPGGSAVTGEAAAALAGAIRKQAGADFALAESGMAGPPDGSRRSLKYGLCWFALDHPAGGHRESIQLNPFLTRREHQLAFARHALSMLGRLLGEVP